MDKNRREDIIPGLTTTNYVHESNHRLLHADSFKMPVGPLGPNGDNLTISFLSLNRASLSVKLLMSIKEHLANFAGEVLVIDNGSDAQELQLIRETIKLLKCRCRIVELGQNYGVAGARNRTIAHVKTDWLMCLDNDIYFIANPLASLQHDLAVLGCHFMSLPLLNPDKETIFALGGHLYVSMTNGLLHLGAGSAYKQTLKPEGNIPGFISTFLFGGSCLFRTKTFEKIGGYDENMFIGFEDLDFSVRLFQEGLKVGSSGTCALVHDHPKPTTHSDINYEKQRFARDTIKKSAEHMTNKHGFKIWSNAVESWLSERHAQLNITENTETKIENNSYSYNSQGLVAPRSSESKKNIALILDTDNWAFGNIARQLIQHLSDKFNFITIPMDVVNNINQVCLLAKECSLLHFFWREHIQLLGTPYYRSQAESYTHSYEEFNEKFIASKILSTSVYDHLLLEPEQVNSRKKLFGETVAGYTVSSKKLNAIYQNLPGCPPPTAIIEDGVDLELFHPINLSRFNNIKTRELVIGWVGNSKWAADIEDFKGVHTILKPALERLSTEGIRVKHFFADRQERFIPHHLMRDYYSQIDVLVCTSKIEGTPNPVLEAMACGVPIISTDVGIVPQAFGKLQSQFILNQRCVDDLILKIKILAFAPELLQQLSGENLTQITQWDWKIKAELFGQYFTKLLNMHGNSCEALGSLALENSVSLA